MLSYANILGSVIGDENENVGDDFIYEEGSYSGPSQSQTPSKMASIRKVGPGEMVSTSQALYRMSQVEKKTGKFRDQSVSSFGDSQSRVTY
jgi:hypothetical protein